MASLVILVLMAMTGTTSSKRFGTHDMPRLRHIYCFVFIALVLGPAQEGIILLHPKQSKKRGPEVSNYSTSWTLLFLVHRRKVLP